MQKFVAEPPIIYLLCVNHKCFAWDSNSIINWKKLKEQFKNEKQKVKEMQNLMCGYNVIYLFTIEKLLE